MAIDVHRRVLIRRVNERIAELTESSLWNPDDELDFHCECGDDGCEARIPATAREFAREKRRGVLVAAGHAARAA